MNRAKNNPVRSVYKTEKHAFCVIIMALIIINSFGIAQTRYSGFYGHKMIVGIQLSVFPPYTDYLNIDPSKKLEIKRSTFKPKATLYMGFLRNSKMQIGIGASIHQPALIDISGFDRKTTYGSNIVVTDTSNATFKSMHYQCYLEFQRYSFLAPVDFYLGYLLGVSVTPYEYQFAKFHQESDVLANTYARTVEYFKPTSNVFTKAFFGFKIGKSCLINKRTSLDLGFKTTIFVNKRLVDPVDLTEANIEGTFKSELKRDVNLNHLLEFYVTYKLFY